MFSVINFLSLILALSTAQISSPSDFIQTDVNQALVEQLEMGSNINNLISVPMIITDEEDLTIEDKFKLPWRPRPIIRPEPRPEPRPDPIDRIPDVEDVDDFTNRFWKFRARFPLIGNSILIGVIIAILAVFASISLVLQQLLGPQWLGAAIVEPFKQLIGVYKHIKNLFKKE